MHSFKHLDEMSVSGIGEVSGIKEISLLELAPVLSKENKTGIEMIQSTGSQSTAQKSTHTCDRVPFLAFIGLTKS